MQDDKTAELRQQVKKKRRIVKDEKATGAFGKLNKAVIFIRGIYALVKVVDLTLQGVNKLWQSLSDFFP